MLIYFTKVENSFTFSLCLLFSWFGCASVFVLLHRWFFIFNIDLFMRGRKRNTSIIYISHSYFDTPKITLLNCNYFAFFKCYNPKEIDRIRKNHVSDLKKAKNQPIYLKTNDESSTERTWYSLKKNYVYYMNEFGSLGSKYQMYTIDKSI